MLGCANTNCGSPPCTTHVIRKGKVVENADSTVPQFSPGRMVCPYCGREFDSRGYDNHLTSCRRARKNLIRVCETLKAKTPPETD